MQTTGPIKTKGYLEFYEFYKYVNAIYPAPKIIGTYPNI
jgi:hypothetical protein